MGLVDELRGSRICIDTAPFIYFIEKEKERIHILKFERRDKVYKRRGS